VYTSYTPPHLNTHAYSLLGLAADGDEVEYGDAVTSALRHARDKLGPEYLYSIGRCVNECMNAWKQPAAK
jgi:hypothetical protein